MRTPAFSFFLVCVCTNIYIYLWEEKKCGRRTAASQRVFTSNKLFAPPRFLVPSQMPTQTPTTGSPTTVPSLQPSGTPTVSRSTHFPIKEFRLWHIYIHTHTPTHIHTHSHIQFTTADGPKPDAHSNAYHRKPTARPTFPLSPPNNTDFVAVGEGYRCDPQFLVDLDTMTIIGRRRE